MDVYVLDKNFKKIDIIDDYTSLIWTTRYYTPGDFELYVAVSLPLINALQLGRYLVREKDIETDGTMRNVMRIDAVRLSTSEENGDYLTVTGKDLKNILAQRVTASQTVINSKIDTALTRLLTLHVISPGDPKRRIASVRRGSDATTYNETIRLQSTGEPLTEVIEGMCEGAQVGWNVYVKDGLIYYYLYDGIDRSYGQTAYPYVVISPEFDNLISSEYQTSKEAFANAAYVAGEGEGEARKIVGVGDARDIDRFETWIDNRNASSNNGAISDQEYRRQLRQDGLDKLAQKDISTKLAGEIASDVNYVLGRDYNLGDIVQIDTGYGIQAKSRIVEIIDSISQDGETIIPTFDEMVL